MNLEYLQALPSPPPGIRYYTSVEQILRARELLAYQHLLLRAWKEMHLSGVLTLDGLPTVYIRDERRPLSPERTAEAHRTFWNQGVATVLVIRDPLRVRVFSALSAPMAPDRADAHTIDRHAVETINIATLAAWAEKLYIQLGNGHYYSGDRARHFDPREGVDAYLLDNLTAVLEQLTAKPSGLLTSMAHAFLGRILFTCYLCDRGIINLSNYFPGRPWVSLRDLFSELRPEQISEELYGKLFPKLKGEFNGSLFDDDLDAEWAAIEPCHLDAIRRFLNGDSVRHGQRSLGFWAYNFKLIPIETISAIYETFLEQEDGGKKRQSGAYYTPRFLAEMSLDIALEGITNLRNRTYVDPASGSGIFLVLLFKRLAAEWRSSQRRRPPVARMAEELQRILALLRGVDKNLTACRIACFSLYIAYLDMFHPPDIREHIRATGAKLPNLLDCAEPRKKKPDIPVVWKRDFFEMTKVWQGQFDIVIGNPPWVGRGQNQIAHEFMEHAPSLAVPGGRICLILPAKVLLNRTDTFQARWLRSITLDRLIQLADYCYVLFENARCPSCIALLTKAVPDIATHEVEYVTPKVARLDVRDGVIPVSPEDRKWIPLRHLLDAAEQGAISVAWKVHLWGTRRDAKLLQYFFTLPRLGDLAGEPEAPVQERKRWVKGQGFQPLGPRSEPDEHPQSIAWTLDNELFVSPNMLEGLYAFPRQMAANLGEHFRLKKYRTDNIHRARSEELYDPPLVLLNQGFTTATYFDYRVRFQAALQSIAGPPADAAVLTAFLRSKLARYFVFHTASNIGTERDKVHVVEFLRLPFFLPSSPVACSDAEGIMAAVAKKMEAQKIKMEGEALSIWQEPVRVGVPSEFRLRRDDEVRDEETQETAKETWLKRQREEWEALQSELEPLIFKYFDLSADEVALIDETCEVFLPSATPTSLEASISMPTMQPLEAVQLEPYAETLTSTLAGWSNGGRPIVASGDVDRELGVAVLKLEQATLPRNFAAKPLSRELLLAMQQLRRAATDEAGHLAYYRDAWFFDGPRIYVVKAALRGHWTRTAALNDATDIYSAIAETHRYASRT